MPRSITGTKRVLFTALATMTAFPLAGALTEPITVTGGQVTGVRGRDPSVLVFKGIPFAAPPMGNLRWRAPQPVAPWHGVRNADQFGNSCVQTVVWERKPWTYEFMTHNSISEDCLYLDVWTAARGPQERRPVYVFIYGGGNNEGSTAVPVYDGETLAKKGIVLVTANYRLGLFGFFTHPELTQETSYKASGNYGILDLVAALKWVHEHIAAFGGDPEKVTVGGQSAGAANTHVLTASPLAKGLFRGAIAESGSGITGGPNRKLMEQEQIGLKFATAKGVSNLATLRAMSWQQLQEPLPDSGANPLSSNYRFAPVIDGYVLPSAIGEVFAQKKQNDVPTLTGSNQDESGASPHPDVTLEGFRKIATARYEELAEEFLNLYPAKTDEEAAIAQNNAARDASRVSTYLWAVERNKTAATGVWTYFWDHALPGPDADKYGAFHTSEVPYVLGALVMSDRPFTADDRHIADMMSSFWANFIAKGDPNGEGLARWPAASEKPGLTMELGDKTGAIPVAGDDAKLKFWEKYYSRPHPPLPRP
jgi:para-nitrobenzyl esterase